MEDSSFREALQKNTVNFEFDNGRIGKICYSSEDPLWVVNIKRGVMSSFQQSLPQLEASQNVTETDVVGRCDTQYISYGTSWGSTKVRKVKDMSSCTGNQALYQYALNLPDINLQHLPIIS